MITFMTFALSLFIYLAFHLYLSFSSAKERYLKLFLFAFILLLVFLPIFIYPLEFGTKITLPKWIKYSADILIAIYVNLTFIYFVSDILRLIRLYPKKWIKGSKKEGTIFITIALLVAFGGYLNNQQVVAVNYEITTNKPNVDLKIAVISDIHIGNNNISPTKLEKAINIINENNVDLVILAGDILDGRSSGLIFMRDDYESIFKKIKSKYGTYAVTGNHEYYTGSTETDLKLIEASNIDFLHDTELKIPSLPNISIIGRDDIRRGRLGNDIKSLSSILSKGNKNTDNYTIVISHNPNTIEESVKEGIDLQISGHTHNGQLFPINFVVASMYETAKGLKDIKDTTLFVTSGLGMWGPPVRTSSIPEVAILTIKTKKP